MASMVEQQQMAEEAQQRQDQRVQQQPQDQNQQPSQKLLEDEDIALEVHKRKIINNVVQGEGKNTHRLIHLPEVREELDRINANLVPTYDEILKIAEFLDWVMPSDEKLHMMQNMPQFFGGFNSVDWMPSQPNFKNDDDGEQNMGDVEEIRDGKDPVITAVGVDFPMLIHETVKGIYELIASNAIPSDAYVAETVMLNTDTLQDEIEDLRYGPFIAADLRDFVNANPLSNQVKNLREHVFGKMTLMPTDEFLALMKGILMKTPRSRAFIDELCQEVEAEVRQNALDIAFAEGDVDAAIPQEDDDVLDPETEKAPKPVQAVKEIDYSKKTKKELNELINDALEAGDYATVDKLRHFL